MHDCTGSERVEGPFLFHFDFDFILFNFYGLIRTGYETRILCVEYQFKASDPDLESLPDE